MTNTTGSSQGFSMINLVIAISVVVCLSWVGVISLGKIRETSLETKLINDVVVLNSAAKVLLAHGGGISDEETTESVLESLKTVSRKGVPGFSSSLVDDRLVWKLQTPEEAKSDKPRVNWNPALKRFEIAYQGPAGIKKFEFSESALVSSNPEEVDRKLPADSYLFSEKDGWIWDYDEKEQALPKPLAQPTKVELAGRTPSAEPVLSQSDWIPASVTDESPVLLVEALAEPEFSVPSGTYNEDDFDLAVTISNPNPEGSSEIVYSVDYGPWSTYDGKPIIVQGGQTIVAKSQSLDSGKSTDSSIASVTYEAASPAPGPAPTIVDSLVEPSVVTKPIYGFGEFSRGSPVLVAMDDPGATDSQETVTLSFDDRGVEFGGIESQKFTDIQGSGAQVGLNVSGTTLISAIEDSSVTGNGETAAFWLSGGMGDSSTTLSIDFGSNPASFVAFMLYHINVSGGGDKLTLSAVTDKGSILSDPVIDSVADADFSVDGNVLDATGYNDDFSKANAGIEFTAPGDEKIVAVTVEWSESSTSVGGYHGVGMGEIRFSFTPQ